MNKQEAIYEREILVSSGDELGVFKVKLYGEKVKGKLVILAISKFGHNPKTFTEVLLKSIQSEMLIRINIDMVKNVQVFLLHDQNASRVVFEAEDSINPFQVEDISISCLDELEF